MIIKSTNKLKKPFNGFPGILVLREDLTFLHEEVGLQAFTVDLDPKEERFWENNEATLVLEIQGFQLPYWKILARAWNADEFHTKSVENKTIVRMWWD